MGGIESTGQAHISARLADSAQPFNDLGAVVAESWGSLYSGAINTSRFKWRLLDMTLSWNQYGGGCRAYPSQLYSPNIVVKPDGIRANPCISLHYTRNPIVNQMELDKLAACRLTCNILDLPTEILLAVFENVLTDSVPLLRKRPALAHSTEIYHAQAKAARLVRVCRRFREIATVLLFETFAWGRREWEFSAVVEHFRAHPHHGALVQRFYCDKNSDNRWSTFAQTRQLFPPFDLFVKLKYLALGGELCLPNLIWIRKHSVIFPQLEKVVIDQSGHTISLEALLPILLLPRLKDVRLFCCNIDISATLSAKEAIDELLEGFPLDDSADLQPLHYLWCVGCFFYEPEKTADWIRTIRGTQGLIVRYFFPQRDDTFHFMNRLAPTLDMLEYHCSAYASPRIPPDLTAFSNLRRLRIKHYDLVDVAIPNRAYHAYAFVPETGGSPFRSGPSHDPAQLPPSIESLDIEISPWTVHRVRFYDYLRRLVDKDSGPLLPQLKHLHLGLICLPDVMFTTSAFGAFNWTRQLIANAEFPGGKNAEGQSFLQRRDALDALSKPTSEHQLLETACRAANVTLAVSSFWGGGEENMEPGLDNI